MRRDISEAERRGFHMLVFLLACLDDQPPAPVVEVHDFEPDPEHCAPDAEARTLEGTLELRPLKGTNQGAFLRTDTDRWVLSYRAEGVLLTLDGARVRVDGHPCQKTSPESVPGPHFALRSLEVLPALP